MVTRRGVPAGDAGYLYLQAKLLDAATRSFPSETAIRRWDELDILKESGKIFDESPYFQNSASVGAVRRGRSKLAYALRRR